MGASCSIQRVSVAAVLLLSMMGCGFVSQSRFTACQTQNRALTEQNNAQLAEIENLKVHAHSVEDRLIEAERSLAQRDANAGSADERSASRARARE